MSDAEGEHGDLSFWRTCVRGPLSVGGEEFFLLFCVEIHVRNRLDVRNANEMRRKDKTELCRIGTLLLSVQHLQSKGQLFFKLLSRDNGIKEPMF